jgi:hypothetical protein
MSEAVALVVKRCGCSEEHARRALLDAGRNGRLIARGSVPLSAHRDLKKAAAHPHRKPEELRASDWGSDIDWIHSRIGRHFDVQITADSIEAWLSPQHVEAESAAIQPATAKASGPSSTEGGGTEPKPRAKAALKAARRAVEALYPDGPPDLIRNKPLVNEITAWMRDQGMSKVSDATILRAAGRRK